MALSPSRAQPFASPKRKREHEDSSSYSPQHSPLKSRNASNLQTYPLLVAQQAATDEPPPSSQSSVTGKFQTLAIRGSTIENGSPPAQHERKKLAAMDIDSSPSTASSTLLLKQFQDTAESNRSPSISTFSFEAPSTIAPETRRRQSRSPPLDGPPQDNFWHDSEITGHNPTDPNDDGYGINGIGFKPSPAIAWARSQKRRQQLADYKSRETREARQRRIERRRLPSFNVDSGKENSEGSMKERSRVRFEDG